MEAFDFSRKVAVFLAGSGGVANGDWQGRKWRCFWVLDHNWQGQKWRCFGGANQDSRRGSALLVVLGMLAFMLFSGLAFSVYMRQSRLPTSFLRRTVATRQLAKAALAEAIENIDQAIGNDPHPGIRASGKSFNENELDNFWIHRVFAGLGTTTDPEQDNNNNSGNKSTTYYAEQVDPSETVPTLTLEGLAYLPPNLINEARYYSQRTPTAKWHSFWFDSGRYAYTAIDVSDYFDVNRVYANKPRSSGNRVSLAHLFEKITASGEDENRTVTHAQGKEEDAQGWDDFMKGYRVADNKMPLVSLADLNVAWGENSYNFGGSAHGNPFNNFVYNSDGPYPGGTSDWEAYRGMTFVTDSWFPKPSQNNVTYNCLADPKYQPFKMKYLEDKTLRPSIDNLYLDYSDILNNDNSWLGNQDSLRLCFPNLVALWDYLDVDSVPISLCVPTVERTPMICGIKPTVDGEIEIPLVQSPEVGDMSSDVVKESKKTLDDGTGWDLYSREITYKIDASKLADAIQDINILTIYPFRNHDYHGKDVDTSWDVDARLSMFLTTGEDATPARVDSGFPAVPKKDRFKELEVTEGSLISFPFEGQETLSTDESGTGKSDVGGSCKLCQLRRKGSGIPNGDDMAIIKVKYTWARDKYPLLDPSDPNSGPNFNATPTPTNKDPLSGGLEFNVESVTVGNFYPLTTNGEKTESNWHNDLASPINLKLNFALWVRVANSKGDAVDFVPACQLDDVNINKGKESKCAQNCGGTDYPLMRAAANKVGDAELQLSVQNLASASPSLGAKVKFPDVKWIVSDPRYNFAPENWVKKTDDGALQESDWTDADWGTGKKMAEIIKERDGDVYMATSDAGYLQSIYELAFLPRVSNGFFLSSDTSFFSGDLDTTFDGKYRDKFSAAKDADFMWKTYSPSGLYRDGEFTELENIIIQDTSVRVCPYATSTEALMAAFANTPHDWRLASTNDPALWNSDGEPAMTASKFNGDHAWNDYSSDETGKMSWDCLQAVAEEFQAKVQKAGNWESAFKDLPWGKDKNKILDFEEIDFEKDADVPMYSVDKKFLYGFWHDSFAARQQLFLIFVRAEPMMMGGGVSGQVPPQLGARAVALVWRDPTKTNNRDGSTTLANPHRTRILFYHQFD